MSGCGREPGEEAARPAGAQSAGGAAGAWTSRLGVQHRRTAPVAAGTNHGGTNRGQERDVVLRHAPDNGLSDRGRGAKPPKMIWTGSPIACGSCALSGVLRAIATTTESR